MEITLKSRTLEAPARACEWWWSPVRNVLPNHKAHDRAALISVSLARHQLPMQNHGYGAIVHRVVYLYRPALAGTYSHTGLPNTHGEMARLSWPARLITMLAISYNATLQELMRHTATCVVLQKHTAWTLTAHQRYRWMRQYTRLHQQYWCPNWCWQTLWCYPFLSPSFRKFLANRTATQYDRLLASSCCPSVCPSVCDAVHCGSQGWCTRLKVVPACS